MKKRGIVAVLLVLLLFLLSSTALAEEEEIFEGNLHHGDYVTVDGVEYVFSVNADGLVTFISATGGGILIYNDTCEQKGTINFCINNVIYDYHNTTTDKDFYYAEVNIFQETAEIEITRDFDDTEITIGEGISIGLILENVGDAAASNIKFEDFFENFSVSFVSEPCYLDGRKIKFDIFQLLKGQKSKFCRYKVIALSPGEFTSIAKVTYDNNIETVTEESDEEDITIKQSLLDMGIGTDKEEVEIGENLIAIVNITNDESEGFSGSMSIIIPSSFKILKKTSGLIFENKNPTWKGTISSGESKYFNVSLLAKRSGDFDLSVTTSFFYKLKLTKSEVSHAFKVKDPDLVLNSNIEERYISGEEANIKITATNPNNFISLDRIKLKGNSVVLGIIFTASKDSLSSKSSFELFNKDVKFPEVSKKTNFPIIVELGYKTSFGQIINQEERIDLIVVPEGYVEGEEDIGSENESRQENISLEIDGEEDEEETEAEVEEEEENNIVEKIERENIIKKAFSNPLLVFIDIVVLFLIVSVVYSLVKGKKKRKLEDVLIDESKKEGKVSGKKEEGKEEEGKKKEAGEKEETEKNKAETDENTKQK